MNFEKMTKEYVNRIVAQSLHIYGLSAEVFQSLKVKKSDYSEIMEEYVSVVNTYTTTELEFKYHTCVLPIATFNGSSLYSIDPALIVDLQFDLLCRDQLIQEEILKIYFPDTKIFSCRVISTIQNSFASNQIFSYRVRAI